MSAIATPNPTASVSPSVGPRPRKWSREEYFRLSADGYFAGQRVERIRGEIVDMSPMNEPHVRGVLLALAVFGDVFADGFTVRPQLPLPLGGESDPEPDIAVVPGGPRDPVPEPGIVRLVVEIADTSLFYDTTTKAELYATAGIADYWVVDLAGRVVTVFRDPAPLPGGAVAYRTRRTVAPGETIGPLHGPAGTAPVAVADLLP